MTIIQRHPAPANAGQDPAIAHLRLNRLQTAARYAWGQLRRRIRVPVTITDPPSDASSTGTSQYRCGTVSCCGSTCFARTTTNEHPVLLSLHPYGKDALPRSAPVPRRLPPVDAVPH